MIQCGAWFVGILGILSFSAAIATAAPEQELIVKSCPELMRMSQTLQEDLRTVDIVLGSALENGAMDRIRTYKMKKSAVRKNVDAVNRALELKGCVKYR